MARLVCQRFNRAGQSILNQGFNRVDRLHTTATKWVKSNLPRRESERRSHPLARHCDILSGIETRLSLLSMTYTKYMDTGSASFIPGKVLDEVCRILHLVQNSAKQTLQGQTSTLPRAHELLQELRDISSMAMEHFDEKIVPIIRHRTQLNGQSPGSPPRSFAVICGHEGGSGGRGAVKMGAVLGAVTSPANSTKCQYENGFLCALNELYPPSSPSPSSSSTAVSPNPPPSQPVVNNQQVPLSEFNQLKKKFSALKRKADETQKANECTIVQQNAQIQSQNQLIHSQNQKISKLERRVDRLAKKFLDCSSKVEDMLRCGKTGIKLQRDDMSLVSGDESESSASYSSPVHENDGEVEMKEEGSLEDEEDKIESGPIDVPGPSNQSVGTTSSSDKGSPIKLRLRQTIGTSKRVALRIDTQADEEGNKDAKSLKRRKLSSVAAQRKRQKL